jgi:hypothetical protein
MKRGKKLQEAKSIINYSPLDAKTKAKSMATPSKHKDAEHIVYPVLPSSVAMPKIAFVLLLL